MPKKAPRKEPFQVHQMIKISYDAYKKYYNEFYKHQPDKYNGLDYAFFRFCDLEFMYKFHHYYNEEGIRRFSRESFKFLINNIDTGEQFRFSSLESKLVYLKCKFYKYNITGTMIQDRKVIRLQNLIIHPKDELPNLVMVDSEGTEYHPFNIVYRMLKILDNEKIRGLIVKPDLINPEVVRAILNLN